MEESESICSLRDNITEKPITEEDQNVLISEIDCGLSKTASKINAVIEKNKCEDNASSLKEKQISKPGNASYFDLSRQHLNVFPVYLYEHCVYIKFLYLEGNFIKELDDNFFPSLMNIKWLDIRNNLLEGLPQNIATHPNLEVLLLQDNKLRTLPLELGLVPMLRGLQVLGNPLEFPPKEVLEKGAKNIIEFLQKEHKLHAASPTIIQPIENQFYATVEAKGTSPATKKKPKSVSAKVSLKRRSTVKLQRAASANFPDVKSYKLQIVPSAFASKSVYNLEGNHTDEAKSFKDLGTRIQKVGKNILQLRPVSEPSNYSRNKMEAKIQDELLKEQLIAKIKVLMEKQLAIIQKWKDKEALKKWRRNEKFQTMERGTVGEPPFAIDPDFMDDAGSAARAGNKFQKQHVVRDVEEEMSQIFQSLQNLGSTRQTKDISPRTQQNLLCNEIQTLMNLQKKLQALKLRNPCQKRPSVPSLPVRGQKVNIEQQ